MNIIEICKYLKISPLVRKIGTEQVSSEESVSEILRQNFESAIENLSGGTNAQIHQASITQAFFDASKALKGHDDLTHLISTPEELAGVLKEIQLNEIQPLLIYLMNKDPTQKSVIGAIFDTTAFDKLTMGYAATYALGAVAGGLGAAAGLYVVYRVSEKFMKRVFGRAPESELDRLIVNEDALKAVIGGLSEIKLCEALMILRHVRCYQKIMETYQPDRSRLKLVLMGVDLTPELFLSAGKSVFKEAQFNKFKRLLNEDEVTDHFTKHLQNSRLLNNTEESLRELFSGQGDKLRYAMMILSCLEIINTLDKITLFTSREESWDNQVDAYQKIYFLSALIKLAHNQLMEQLDEDEETKLNKILTLYLPIHFYSYLQNAIVTQVDERMSEIFSSGRIAYYDEGASKFSQTDEEVKAKLVSYLPEIQKVLALDIEGREETLELLCDTDAASVAEVKEEIQSDYSSDADLEYHDALSSEASSDDSSNSSSSDQNEFVVVDRELIATERLNPEELAALTQELKECLNRNCMRITKDLGLYTKSREAIRKKISFLARCYVTLDHLVFDTEENILKNKTILASICVQVFLISSIETNYLSLLTELSSGTLDALVSTQTYGSRSFREIKNILDQYEFQVLRNEKDLSRIVRCFNDGIWPVVCSALFHFERSLYDARQNNKLSAANTAPAVSSYSLFSLGARIPALIDPTILRATMSGGLEMINRCYANVYTYMHGAEQSTDTEEMKEDPKIRVYS